MQVLAIIGGVILLLPGLCSLGFITLSVSNLSRGGMRDAVSWAPLWIVCFARRIKLDPPTRNALLPQYCTVIPAEPGI
jgi:hypothetical protein